MKYGLHTSAGESLDNYSSNYIPIFFIVILFLTFTVFNIAYGSEEIESLLHKAGDGAHVVAAVKNGQVIDAYTYDPNEEIRIIVQFSSPPLAQVRADQQRKGRSQEELNGIVQSIHSNIITEHNRFRNDLSSIEYTIERDFQKRQVQPASSQIFAEYTTVFNGVALTTSRWVADEIQNLSYVHGVDPDNTVEVYITDADNVVNAGTVRNTYNISGEGIVVGILDTGIDYMHPALGGGVGPEYKVIGGKNFTTNDEYDFMDRHFHGTHVAGIVAANGNTIQGIAPDARLRAYKVLDDQGIGQQSWVISGIEQAVIDGVDIINLSLGGTGHPNDPGSQAIDVATEAGVLCVVAAGNSADYMTIGSPGTARSAVTVGASMNNDIITDFSSRGPTLRTYEVKPDIVAPGFRINSTVLNGGYGRASGTSMATPVVAGAAALYLEKFPGTDPIDVKAVLMNTAVSIGEDVWTQGAGRLDILKTIESDISVSAGNLFFGVIDHNQGDWEVKDTLTVRNHSDLQQNFSLAVNEPLPAGAHMHFGNSSFTLDPGSERDIIVTFTAQQSLDLKPVPPGYFGSIKVETDNNSVQSIYAFIKSPMIEVTFDTVPVIMAVYNDSDYFRVYHSSILSENVRFLLPADTYDIFTVWRIPGSRGSYGVSIRDDLALTDYINLDLSLSQAIHSIEYDVRNEFHEPISLTRQFSYFYRNDVEVGLFTTIPAITRITPLSNNYNFDTKVLSYSLLHRRAPVYEFLFEITEGLNDDIIFEHEPGELRKLRMIYEGHLGNSVWYQNRTYVSPFDTRVSGEGELMASPLQRSFYFLPPPSDTYYPWFNRREHVLAAEDGTHLYRTSQIALTVDGNFAFYKNSFTPEPVFTSGDVVVTNDIGKTTPVWTGYTQNATSVVEITRKTREEDQQGSATGFFTDIFGGAVQKDISFKLSDEDGQIVEEGSLGDLISQWQTPVTAGEFKLELQQSDYQIHMMEGLATAELTFDTQKSDRDPPFITGFFITSDGKPAAVVKHGQENKIALQIEDDDEVANVALFLQPLHEGEWQPLLFEISNDVYTLSINDTLQDGLYYSFRVVAEDLSGNILQYTAEPAFYLQGQSETLPPGFVALIAPADGSTNVPLDEELRWYQSQYADSYRLQLSEEPDFLTPVYDADDITTSRLSPFLLEKNTLYYWRVKGKNVAGESEWSPVWQFTTGTATDVDYIDDLPDMYILRQNFPNPFNPSTTIQFGLPAAGHVTITVYNTLGQKVGTIVDSFHESGYHEIVWYADVPSGVYFYRIEALSFLDPAQRFVQTKRFVVLK